MRLAKDYDELKFEASEEALVWPLSVVIEDDGEVGIWCDKEDCPLDCENALIWRMPYREEDDRAGRNASLTVGNLLYVLTDHIIYSNDRKAELAPPE